MYPSRGYQPPYNIFLVARRIYSCGRMPSWLDALTISSHVVIDHVTLQGLDLTRRLGMENLSSIF